MASIDNMLASDDRETRYRAPALEKGLDILETLVRTRQPMTVAMITQELGRSTGELFRMIQVLEHRGYIEQRNGNGYVPTSKLFALGMTQAPIKNLLEVALPTMRKLAEQTDQSCHLTTRSGGDIVVVARMESASLLGFSVRLGYRQPITTTASGTVLYAFQPADVRQHWEADFTTLDAAGLAQFRRHADTVAQQGYDQHCSGVVPGILDLSAPVLRGEVAAAALTMPFVMKTPVPVGVADALTLVRDAASTISSELASMDVCI